jgi:hypothetical protein
MFGVTLEGVHQRYWGGRARLTFLLRNWYFLILEIFFVPAFDELKTMEIAFDEVILAVGQRTEPGLRVRVRARVRARIRIKANT